MGGTGELISGGMTRTVPPRRLVCLAATLLLVAQGATAQISELPHRADPNSFFGASVAIFADDAAVGASGYSSCGENAGAVFLFARDDATGMWQRAARVECAECRPNAFFGRDVALEGDILVVGAGGEFFGAGRHELAHVFERHSEGMWREIAHLEPQSLSATDSYATSVDISDGRILAVAPGDHARGAYPGAAFVFERDREGNWVQSARISPAGAATRGVFGGSGAIDGDRVVVTAPARLGETDGSVYVFEYGDMAQVWLQRGRFDGFSSASLAVDLLADRILVGDHQGGSQQRGTARLYQRDSTGSWQQSVVLQPSVSSQSGAYGTAVALAENRALVVGYDEQLDQEANIDRVVFVFDDEGEEGWPQRQVIDVGETEFGSSIDYHIGQALIGSSGEMRPGAAYVVLIP